MGNQVTSIKTAAGRFAFESKRGPKAEKVKIGILAFEVANVMSKAVQLWQSLGEKEIVRLRDEVIKSEGVLRLVSDDENILLSLACMEKLQDLTTVALAVARLGKRCHEPALQGFEHVYNDILKQNIDVKELQFPRREMESKVKKMDRYIATTSNLYQELEMLSEMEQAQRRLQDDNDAAQKDTLYALEHKIAWQRQEIKYLKDVSLWNRTYDKIVGLLARTVCTTYGRIIDVFAFPVTGWPQLKVFSKNGEVHQPPSGASPQRIDSNMLPSGSQASYMKPEAPTLSPKKFGHGNFLFSNGVPYGSAEQTSSAAFVNGDSANPQYVVPESFRPSSPGPESSQLTNTNANHQSGIENNGASSVFSKMDAASGSFVPKSERDQVVLPPVRDRLTTSASTNGSSGLWSSNGAYENGESVKLAFNSKISLQNAPPSTLGGAALALHYANVIIIVEKMAQYPHLISQDARNDLYQMLPKNVRVALRAKLMRGVNLPNYDGTHAADWKEAVERILGWLAPLAQNMIRWQSERKFEQQQVVARSNVLLLQTLYFADQLKAEAAITDLLVGLNYLWRQQRELDIMDYATKKDSDEYLEWQL